jgi:putative glutamine amidotransferase
MPRMPYVGLTMSVTDGASGERVSLNSAYAEAVQWAGGVPVLLPATLDARRQDELMDNLQGLVLTGGGDIDPSLYGEPAHPETKGISARRDNFEREIIRRALERRMPILAICRGMQMLNVALGGTLYQHVPQAFGDTVQHDQVAAGLPRHELVHPVEVRAGTLLGNIVGSGAVGVNSMHHQGVRSLGMHLVPVARAADGLIEAVEAPALGPFVMGVQWHPEELIADSQAARRLFDSFLAACDSGSPVLAAAGAG